MTPVMAYFLGMYYGNGKVTKSSIDDKICISIEIPHKNLKTEQKQDVSLYIEASLNKIKNMLQPLFKVNFEDCQLKARTILFVVLDNNDSLCIEFLKFTSNINACEYITVPNIIRNNFSRDEKIYFLKGFSDVTGYIRKSNSLFGNKERPRVYLEVPQNWQLVIDICNLLKDVDIPVQNIDWAHPNIRDGNLAYYKKGKPDAWKKEHQIKIFANEFNPIGFIVKHKEETLKELSEELENSLESEKRKNKLAKYVPSTHKFYWETREKKNKKEKPKHPSENDQFIPDSIRGKHYNNWKDIAKDLGYGR